MAIQATMQQTYIEADIYPDFSIPDIARLDDPRFFCQFTYDVMSVDTFSIPDCAIRRGVITPCVSFKQKLPLFEIREADLIHGSKENDREGKPYYGMIWRRASIEADRLVELERRTDYPNGVRELTTLRALPNLYRRRINHLFYSGVDWAALETNEAMLAHLRSRLASLRADPPPELKADEREALEKVGQELIEACEYSDSLQRRSLEISHTRMKLPPSDKDFKKQYDDVDEIFLRRTGIKRLSEIDQRMAGALEKLSNVQQSSGDPELKQLIANMNQLLGVLVAERTEPAKKGGK